MAFVVSLLQNKGGCGKTTLAATLYAARLSRSDSPGIAVGLVDLDPQGNASAWSLGRRGFLATPRHTGTESLCTPDGVLTERFSGNRSPNEWAKHVVPCRRIDGGFIVPANPYMRRHGIDGIELDTLPFSVAVVDTPPQMESTLLRSVVVQSDVVVVPVQPEPFCVQNIVELLAEIENAGCGDMLENGRVRLVFNMVQRCVTHASWAALVSAQWGNLLSPVSIARATAWADVTNHAAKWNPRGKPAAIANTLWDDIQSITARREAA